MTRLASVALHIGVRAAEPPRVVVHTTPEQLAAAHTRDGAAFAKPAAGAATSEQTRPLTPTTLALLACHAWGHLPLAGDTNRVLLNDSGRVLQMTTLGRYFTPAQHRALAARDLGCAFPGCDRPPSWTDAHHVIYARHAGPTTIDNGVLLCGPHHTEIHLGHRTITMRDGIPWFTPPPHLDPDQRPVRNAVHQAAADTRRRAQQLILPWNASDASDAHDEQPDTS